MFIDEGDVFEEIYEFVYYLQNLWSLRIVFLRNEDVISKASKIGDMIRVASLNQANQAALQEIGFSEPEFEFLPDSTLCNHLMKTMAMKEFILQNNIKALATAIRWDEMTARKDEDYFSERSNPAMLGFIQSFI